MFVPGLGGTGVWDRRSLIRPTTIRDRCFIGVNAVVLCGVTVGPDSIVGAGAVVCHDVPPRTVVAGNPARVICSIDQFIAKHRAQMVEHPEWYPAVPRAIDATKGQTGDV
jgi:serine acetyltransferase